MQPNAGHGQYRPDIDGLRAIAVLSVIAYHLGLPFAGSGYAGVDVFFVISGFLIGGIVLRERAAGSFTYRSFYARRARRILPALCAIIVVTIPFAWAVMTPHELRYFGGAIFATLLFASNIWFYDRIDYFNPNSDLDPLLHTWSLGVEEQFYLLFPPLVAVAARFGRRSILPILAVLGLISLALALGTSAARPTLSFYMLHTRLWEMMAGVMAAAALYRAGQLPTWAQAGLSILGLVLVLVGVTLLPATQAWPGITTLVPVFGAVLLVLFGSAQGPARMVLASPPFRAIGLVSYSAYLIHHPLITMLHLSEVPIDSPVANAGIIGLTLVLAGLSWALVEQPFRGRTALAGRHKWLLGAGVAGLAVFAVAGHVTKGYPSRLPEQARAVLEFSQSHSPTLDRCRIGRDDVAGWNPDSSCVHNPAATGPQIVIWGDSHVAAGSHGIAEAMPNFPVREFSTGGCPPIPGMQNIDQMTNAPVVSAKGCALFNQIVRDWVLAYDSVKLVILYSYWANYIERDDFDTRDGYVLPDVQFGVPVGNDGSIPEAARQAYLQQNFAGLVTDLTAAGKQVLIVYPLPIAARNLPQYIARQIWKQGINPKTVGYPEAAFRDYTANSRAVLDAAPTGPRVHRIDLSDQFCVAGTCTLYESGTPYFFDTNHLSQPGVGRIAPGIAAAVTQILAKTAP